VRPGEWGADGVRVNGRSFLGPVASARVLVLALSLSLLPGALITGCRALGELGSDSVSETEGGDPASSGQDDRGSGGSGTLLALVCGQPGDGSVLAYLPPGSYTLSPTGRYLTVTESREEEPGLMFYRPAVYEIGGLLGTDPPPSPPELERSAPDYWVRADDTSFRGWVLGDHALAIGDSRRVVLWWPETGETEILLEHPAVEAGEFAYHGGAVSPDGRSLALAVSGPDGMIRLEQVLLGSSMEAIEVQGAVTLVAELEERTEYPGAFGFPYEQVRLTWAPDCRSLAVSVHRWEDGNDPESWFWEVLLFRVHSAAITPFATDVVVRSWSPDGAYLVLEPNQGTGHGFPAARASWRTRMIGPS